MPPEQKNKLTYAAMAGSLVITASVLLIWQPGAVDPDMAVLEPLPENLSVPFDPATTSQDTAELLPLTSFEVADNTSTRRATPDLTRPIVPSPELSELIKRALKEGMTQEEIDKILGRAIQSGDVAVPSGMMTASGNVDTGVLVEAMGSSEADIDLSTVEQTYTVQSGDSLARIALIFYGEPYDYPRIFAANADKVKRPDLIYAGQVLTIPPAIEP